MQSKLTLAMPIGDADSTVAGAILGSCEIWSDADKVCLSLCGFRSATSRITRMLRKVELVQVEASLFAV
jgi:hypothetical protein